MSKAAFNKIKTQKYKTMIRAFQRIQPNQKQAILKEYFTMCKMVYRIRTTVAYFQDVDHDHSDSKPTPLEQIKELFNEDPTFAKMISIVKGCLINVFEGTDPGQPLLNAVDESASFASRKSLKQQQSSSASIFQNTALRQVIEEEDDFFMTSALVTPKQKFQKKNKNVEYESSSYSDSMSDNQYDFSIPEITETMHTTLSTLASYELLTVDQ